MQADDSLQPIPPDSLAKFKEIANGYRANFEVLEASPETPQPDELSFSFIISTSWLESLRNYIGYPAILENKESAMTSGVHPGKVNEDIVLVSDSQEKLMVPVGSPHDYLNVRLIEKLEFNKDYRIIEKPAWDFIKSHFPKAIEVKRTNYINDEGTLKTEVYHQEVIIAHSFPDSFELMRFAPLELMSGSWFVGDSFEESRLK